MAPSQMPSSTVPSAPTSGAVAFGSVQAEAPPAALEDAPGEVSAGCFSLITGLNLGRRRRIVGSTRGRAISRKAIAVLRDEINTALRDAMKARDQRRVSTLRLVNAAIKNADIEAQGKGKPTLSDEELLGLLQKLIKQRQEAIELYDKAGRTELADRERGEIEIITAYLPKQMSDAEAQAAVAQVIKATGATGIKDMGKVMAALQQGYAGRLDFGKASGLVKTMLSG